MGKTQTPPALENVQQDISNQQSGLAQRAADYTTQQKAKQNYGLDTSILDKAISGDNDARSSTSGLLNRQNIESVDNFDPGNTTVKNVDLLGDKTGLKQLASIGQGPQYTQGMGAFDAMLLQRDPNFQAKARDLQRQNSEFQAAAQAQAPQVQQAANDYGTKALADAQGAAKGYLGNQQQAILAQEKAAADAANKHLGSLDNVTVAQQAVEAAKAKAKADLDAQFGAGRADSMLLNSQDKIHPLDFVNFLQQYDPNQFVSQDQASKYNNINQLLGLGGQAQVASGAAPDPYTVNTQGLISALKDPAAAARMQADIADQQQIAKILEGANTTAQSRNQANPELVGGYGSSLDTYGKSLVPTLDKSLNPYATDNNISFYGSKFAQDNPLNSYYTNPLQATDVLGQNDVNQLTTLQKDLYGSGPGATNYSVGKYANTPGLFDQGSYQKGLMDYLGGLKSSHEAEVAATAAQAPAVQQALATTPVGTTPTLAGSGGTAPDQKLNTDYTGGQEVNSAGFLTQAGYNPINQALQPVRSWSGQKLNQYNN